MYKMSAKRREEKKAKPAVRVFRDGREWCNLLNKEGREEYARRIRVMWERQGKRCCLEYWVPGCSGRLALADAVFEHQEARGMGGGRRDDRIEIDGKPYNGAAHAWCNSKKGSTRMDYLEVP